MEPLKSLLFREVVTEGLSFYAWEEEPVIKVGLQGPLEVLACERASSKKALKKDEATGFIFQLKAASNIPHGLCLVISHV